MAGDMGDRKNASRPLTIALVVDTAGNGGNGTSNSAFQFAAELERQGHQVRLVGIGAPQYAAVERHVPFISMVAAKHQMHFAQPDETLFRRAFTGADVVHLYIPLTFEQAALSVARSMRIPVSCGFHAQPENITYSAGPLRYVPGVDSMIYALFRHWLYRKVRHVHVPTRLTADLLRAHGYRNDLHIISNGYEARFVPLTGQASQQPWTPPSTRGGRPFHILAVGRLAGEKDHATLIRAVGMCSHRADVELTIAGTGPLKAKLTRMAARWCARPASISFHDHADMPALLRSADLLIHPSIADLEGISVMEGLACGLVPVIADSPLSAAKDFALDRRSLYPVGDAKALAAHIDWWIDHAAERARMSGMYAAAMRREHALSVSVARFALMERAAIADDLAWYAGLPRPTTFLLEGSGATRGNEDDDERSTERV